MTKYEIDYSNTIIYKITCNEPSVTEKYVGHTTNFVQRKSAHKNSTKNEKSACYNLKLYKTIRENGGWDNWRMEMISFYNCKNLHEAKLKEQEHFIELKATLNSIEPVKPKNNNPSIDKLIDTANLDKIQQSNLPFKCEPCNYESNSKKDYNKHLDTKKHCCSNTKKPKVYTCDKCNNSYKFHSGLWKHKLSCKGIEKTESDTPKMLELIAKLMNSNLEMNKQLIESNKRIIELSEKN